MTSLLNTLGVRIHEGGFFSKLISGGLFIRTLEYMASIIDVQHSQLISLPTDVIELILFSEVIDYLSLTRLSLVCHRLHTITLSNKIWKLQGKRRYLHLCDIYLFIYLIIYQAIDPNYIRLFILGVLSKADN